MRSSSHRSSSTFNTGMLEAARVSPAVRRRLASSRPRLWGGETTRGAGISEFLFRDNSEITTCNSIWFKKSSLSQGQSRDGTIWVPVCFSRRWQSNRCPAGLEERLHVDWNDYPDHSHHRFTWRL